VRGELGRGTSIVYEGWDPAISRRVAIKVLRLSNDDETESQDSLERFRREAQVAGELVHPNIVGLFDFHEGKGDAYSVMELVEGRSLAEVLREKRRMTLPQALSVMEGLLAALQFIHARNIVHRDIKPANVLLTHNGQTKLTDFGVAHTESSEITQDRRIGTPAYMPPEQHRGEAVDARSDIFSAGVLLLELLTGRRTYQDRSTGSRHHWLEDEPVAIPKTVRQRLDAVIAKATAARPADRYSDAASFAEALRKAAAVTSGSGNGSVGKLHRVALVAMGGAALALAGYGLHRALEGPHPAIDPLRVLADTVAEVPCSQVSVQGGDAGPLVVNGLAGDKTDVRLRTAAAAVTDRPLVWRVDTFDERYCPALDMLRPLMTRPGGAGRGLVISLPGNRTVFEDGDDLVVDVVMPDFAAHLLLIALMVDGSEFLMMPSAQYPDRPLAAREHVRLGAREGAFGGWSFQPPFGRDMLVAVASTQPLSQAGGNDDQDSAPNLVRLRDAITGALSRGETLAAAVTLVNTTSKR
jgi:serine/threonine-protein kinase